VICRTSRGLELGQILSQLDASSAPSDPSTADGSILRRVSIQDDLLIARLDRSKSDAIDHCTKLVEERKLSALLMDVEHLFDGQSIYFYFLGDVTTELEQLTEELTEAYEAKVQFRKFTDTLEAGCGPDCGTDAGGCGSEGCSTCAVASACKVSHAEPTSQPTRS